MKVHFISIGGSVMHQLAIALKKKGYMVTGTDDEIFEPSRSNLQREGLLPEGIGWNPDMITPDLDAVILGMHAKADNPEIEKAREMKLPIYSFPEYIYKESKEKLRVVIGGSHGKTTTTAMIMHVLKYAEKNFDYLVGAKLNGFEQSVDITDAPLIICEGDEYPASVIEKKPKFHFLFPHVAVLTGIAWDHINVFPTFENYLEQFSIFISRLESGGLLIYNESDPVLAHLVEGSQRSDITYQPYSVPLHAIDRGQTSVNIEGHDITLNVFGEHNLLNLQACWLVCRYLKVDICTFAEAISTFKGASKRLEVIARNERTIVYRDFAHAPSKVKATITAVKQQFKARKLIAVLELHTFSSLNSGFMSEYEGAMEEADVAAVFYSAHALELKRMPQLPAEIVKQGFKKEGLEILTERDDLYNWLCGQSYADTNLLLMSSGNYDGLDINKFATQVAQKAECLY